MTKKKATRRKLKRGQYWCLFPNGLATKPMLVHDPGSYFEGNAKHFGHRIAVVKLVEV